MAESPPPDAANDIGLRPIVLPVEPYFEFVRKLNRALAELEAEHGTRPSWNDDFRRTPR